MSFKHILSGACFALALSLSQFALAEAQAERAEKNLYQVAMELMAEGRYDEMRVVLEELVSTEPEHAGAWLDIAMLYCSMGNAEKAEALFDSIEARFLPPPGIRDVIAQRRAQGCKVEKKTFFSRMQLGYGFDSNVNQGARNPNFSVGGGDTQINLVLAPEFSPRSDHFTALSGEFAKELTSSGTLGFVQLNARKYETLSQFDMNRLLLGVEHPWKISNWELRSTAALGVVTLDGATYQRQSQLQLYVAPPLPLPTSWKLGVAGGWTHLNYPSLTNFDSDWWELRAMLTHRSALAFVQASLGYALDHGSEQRPGNDRSGPIASLTGRFKLSEKVLGELSWNFQNWRGAKPYSPGFIDQVREQSTHVLRAAVIVPVAAEHALHLEYRNVKNNENISLFEYQGSIFQASWQWNFGD